MSGEVSRTVSTTSTTVTRRHSYNTRSAGRNSNTGRNCNVGRSPLPLSIREERQCEDPIYQELDPMDNCFEHQEQHQRRKKNWCHTCISTFAYSLALSCILFVGWSFYVMRDEIKKLEEQVVNLTASNINETLLLNISEKCVNDTLIKLQQDPIGRPDFALESSGGRIINVDAMPFTDGPKKLFSFSFCENYSVQNSASAMIRATTSPGECWSFKGQSGTVMIQLISSILIDSVTLEHIPQNLSPSGTIDSAPKDFKIWGITVPKRGKRQFLGKFRYEDNNTTVQTFKIDNTDNFFEYVDFEVLSNHGNKDYTCVYRLRVHGTLKKP